MDYTVFSFTGDGATTEFTLPVTPFSANYVRVAVDGVTQEPGVAYTVYDDTLKFYENPWNGAAIFGFVFCATAIDIGVPSPCTVGANEIKASDADAICDVLGVYSKGEADLLLAGKEGASSSGNSENGYYVRFDNGVQICRHCLSVPLAISTVVGSVFRSSHVMWTYPSQFIAGSIPIVTANFFASGAGSDADVWIGNVYSAGAAAAQVNLFSATTKTSSTRTIMLMAIGRWK